jgi:hypothetical protein
MFQLALYLLLNVIINTFACKLFFRLRRHTCVTLLYVNTCLCCSSSKMPRWEWLRRTDQARSWHALPSHPERAVRAFFQVAVHVEVGNGSNTLFWTDRWISGHYWTYSTFPPGGGANSAEAPNVQLGAAQQSLGHRHKRGADSPGDLGLLARL